MVDSTKPKGTWVYGLPGVGKSHFVRHKFLTDESFTSEDVFLKSQNKWWCGYRGEPVVLLDDLDEGGSCLSHLLKIWADQYGFKGEAKFGSVVCKFRHFVVTSNFLPRDLF